MKLTLEFLAQEFSVCQVEDYSEVNLMGDYTFTGKTSEECSLVCPTCAVPPYTLKREDGWIALHIAGVLDFSLIGILADLSNRLAQVKISIFALSTYNTDYVLIRKENKAKAIEVLKAHYTIKQIISCQSA